VGSWQNSRHRNYRRRRPGGDRRPPQGEGCKPSCLPWRCKLPHRRRDLQPPPLPAPPAL